MDKNKCEAAGINYSEGIMRFGNRVEMYEKYLKRFPEDQSFQQLNDAIERKDYEAAFKAAHALKGLAGNLSVQQVLTSVSALTEELRKNPDPAKVEELFKQAKIDYDNVIEFFNENM